MDQAYENLRQKMQERTGEDSGVTMVEYAVLLGLIVLLSMSVCHAIGLWNAQTFAALVDGLNV